MRQALILSALDRDPGVTSAGMAQRMMITPQAMGEMLAEMEKAGLLKRQAAKGNARKRAIFLTAGGKKALATCRGAMHQVEERMLAPLSAAERKTLNRLLGDCIAGLNK
jgi:DNA-binding MarR family transcriptional regulator